MSLITSVTSNILDIMRLGDFLFYRRNNSARYLNFYSSMTLAHIFTTLPFKIRSRHKRTLETRTSRNRSAEEENISSVPGDTEVDATDVFAALANVSSKTGRRYDSASAVKVHGEPNIS